MILPDMADREVNAVFTTGIYCRSGCSGRPLPANCAPFPSAVAAQAAGFRPCLLCRPDRRAEVLIDGSTPEVVRQALMLISDGFMDQNTAVMLGRRLGISTRHLNRLFEDYLGATPTLIAQSRRAHFARRLLDETDLTITDVSSASGFRSVRQMNRVMMGVFRFSPSELRKKRREARRLVADGGLRLRIPTPVGFDLEPVLRYLGPRSIPGVESVVDGVYRRVTNTCGYPGVVEVTTRRDGDGLEMVAHLPSYVGLLDDVARCRSLFGLHVDYTEARTQLEDDNALMPLVSARPGLTIPGSWDRFETAVLAVLEQYGTVSSASKNAGKIASNFGIPVPGLAQMELGFLFPSAEPLAQADLGELGLSTAGTDAVRSVSEAVADGSLDLYDHSELPTLLARLQEVPGSGRSAAATMAMRVFGHLDAFPGSETAEAGDHWRPWRSLAFSYLLDSETDRSGNDAEMEPIGTIAR